MPSVCLLCDFPNFFRSQRFFDVTDVTLGQVHADAVTREDIDLYLGNCRRVNGRLCFWLRGP